MFLIDGYNLLHALIRGRKKEGAREQLVALLVEYCTRENYQARIVFDPTSGMKRQETRGLVEIVNAAQGRTADEIILGDLAGSSDSKSYTVVSNDLGIVKAAEKGGYKVLSCQEFGQKLAARPETPEKGDVVPPGEVDYWMKEFGLED